jgi:hypothetical protein
MKIASATLILIVASTALPLPLQNPADNLTSPLAMSVSLRQFGATGNGTSDDMTAVVTAFSRVCASGGGTIYVPSGVFIIDPGSSSIPVCSHLVVSGPGTFKVKANSGNYRYIFAPPSMMDAVTDLTFTGITIDQNTFSNNTGTIRVGDNATLQHVWQIFGGSNLHFEDMRLFVSGVNPIDVNGPGISGIYISRNYIVFQKRPGQPEFDNSSIYIHGTDYHVTDNTFRSTLADAAVTAIEVHEGSGSVTGNTIDSFAFGMNLVDLHGATVSGNSLRNAAYGLALWSLTGMDSVVLQGNTVSLNQVTRNAPSAWGIATSYNLGINGDFSNLQISGNIITFERESSARTTANNVNYGIGLQALGNITDVAVLGNQIVRPPVRGVVVGVPEAKYTTSRVSVRDNRIVDAGSNLSPGTSDYSAAIALQGNLVSIDVIRNRLDFPSIPFAGRYRCWSNENGYTFRDVIVAENYGMASSGSPENGLTRSVVQRYPPE